MIFHVGHCLCHTFSKSQRKWSVNTVQKVMCLILFVLLLSIQNFCSLSSKICPNNLDTSDDKVYDENSEMSSFLPTNINRRKEKDIIRNQFLDQTKKHECHVGNEPLNEFTVPFLATMCFPTLFPDRKGDPTNNAILLDTGTNFTDAFASKLKHLIKFSEG